MPHRPDFERLCDLAEVKGLHIGLTVSHRMRRPGSEQQFRDLEAVVVLNPAGVYPAVRINRSIDVAARRLLEVIK